jgi:hypothetical protein
MPLACALLQGDRAADGLPIMTHVSQIPQTAPFAPALLYLNAFYAGDVITPSFNKCTRLGVILSL